MSHVIAPLAESIDSSELTDAELNDEIEATGSLSARLYAQGIDTTEIEARLDDLMAEFERRQTKPRDVEPMRPAIGDHVLVRHGGEWAPATVHRVYALGVDAIVGEHGCWYFSFDDVRVVEVGEVGEVGPSTPTNEYDAGSEPTFSVFAPHYRTGNLIARGITFARARQIAEHHGAFVYRTSDLPAAA